MKRILAWGLVLVMLLCAVASAEACGIQQGAEMASDMTDCMLYVGFAVEDVSGAEIFATIYDEVFYDLADVNHLSVGDTLETADGDIEVVSGETDEYGCVLINGGAEEGGVTLFAADEDNCYRAMSCDLVEKMAMGQAALTMADEATVSIYRHDEFLSPAGEGYDSVAVAAADVAGQLAEFSEESASEFTPCKTGAVVENGVLIEIIVDYVP